MDQRIQHFLDALETADRVQAADLAARTEQIQSKLQKPRHKMRGLQTVREQLGQTPDHQLSLTDTDSRVMTSHSMKGTALVGHSVQTASCPKPCGSR